MISFCHSTCGSVDASPLVKNMLISRLCACMWSLPKYTQRTHLDDIRAGHGTLMMHVNDDGIPLPAHSSLGNFRLHGGSEEQHLRTLPGDGDVLPHLALSEVRHLHRSVDAKISLTLLGWARRVSTGNNVDIAALFLQYQHLRSQPVGLGCKGHSAHES